MIRRAARAVTVAGLALLPLLGSGVGGAVASGGAPAPEASPAGPRLVLDWAQVEVGGWVGVGITGMPAGWDAVTVSSPALAAPVRLTPKRKGASDSRRFPESEGEDVRAGIAPGSYPVTATRAGHTVATTRLTVTAPAPALITRFVAGPKSGNLGSADSTPRVTVRPGSEVVVLLADHNPAREEDTLTVRSTAFREPLSISTDNSDDPGCKCDDGATVYAGHTTLRGDLPAGTYPLTVVSHQGKQTSTAQLSVGGRPVTHYGRWVISGGVAVALAGVLALVLRRLRLKRR
ncbi:hypothetical protein [Streptomyces sp. NPDC050485]|uniref:hypothetical protein n=1 Tax=Streptomyces sp. NPDC050485 TaxID=3365617 RepID=UPI0037A60D9B